MAGLSPTQDVPLDKLAKLLPAPERVRAALRRGGATRTETLSIGALSMDRLRRIVKAGDATLKVFAGVLRSTCRASDTVTRWGGEEFVVVIPETPLRSGLAVAARIMRSLRREEMPHAGTRVRGDRVTVSIGAAAACPGPKVSPSDLLQAADLALYEAKEAGRDAIRSRRLDDTGGFAGDHR